MYADQALEAAFVYLTPSTLIFGAGGPAESELYSTLWHIAFFAQSNDVMRLQMCCTGTGKLWARRHAGSKKHGQCVTHQFEDTSGYHSIILHFFPDLLTTLGLVCLPARLPPLLPLPRFSVCAELWSHSSDESMMYYSGAPSHKQTQTQYAHACVLNCRWSSWLLALQLCFPSVIQVWLCMHVCMYVCECCVTCRTVALWQWCSFSRQWSVRQVSLEQTHMSQRHHLSR